MSYRKNQKFLKNVRAKLDGETNNIKLNARSETLKNQVTAYKRKQKKEREYKREIEGRARRERREFTTEGRFIINGYQSFRIQYNRPINSLSQFHDAIISVSRQLNIYPPNLILHFLDSSEPRRKRVLNLTVNSNDVGFKEDFIERVEEMKRGGENGSDKYNGVTHSLLYNIFDLYVYRAIGGGKSDTIVYVSEGIESKKNECAKLSLECLGVKNTNRNLSYLADMAKFLMENEDLKISLLSNCFYIKTVFDEIFKRESIKIKINGKNHRLFKLEDSDISHMSLTPSIKNADNYIVYDNNKEHYDAIKGEPKLNEHVYIDFNHTIIIKKGNGEYEKLYTAKQREEIRKVKHENKINYVFYDFETVIDWKNYNCVSPYALTMLKIDDDTMNILNNCDENEDIEGIETIIKNRITYTTGYDCCKSIVELLNNQENEFYKFVSFNGSKFDNFIMLDYLLKEKSKGNISYIIDPTKIFYANNELLNFTVNVNDTFDLAKHLSGSLSKLCDDFKVKLCSKTSFDHNLAQKLHDEGNLIKTIEKDETFKKYCVNDVLSLCVLFHKYRETLKQIPITKEINLTDSLTIGSVIMKVAKDYWKDNKIKFPKLSLEQYKDLLKYRVAGRVELFNGSEKFNSRMYSVDVSSMYGYILSIGKYYYPCGDKIIETKQYKKNRIGFYYCDVDQSNLIDKGLPMILAEKVKEGNNWNQTKFKDYFISSAIIEQLLKYGCKVKIGKGFYFDEAKKSYEMFGFLHDFMKVKQEQDEFKKEGDCKYNESLRQVSKLYTNSVSGKLAERLHTQKTIATDNTDKYVQLITDKNVKRVSGMKQVGDTILMTYDKTEESIINEQRPIFQSCILYDYAKCYMYDNVYAIVGIDDMIYTDTDSGKMKEKAFNKWCEYATKKTIPHFKEIETLLDAKYKDHKLYDSNSKIFGSFENELGDNNLNYCLCKKTWFSCMTDENGNDTNIKMSIKGVANNSIFITDDEATEHMEKSEEEKHKFYSDNLNKRILYKDDKGIERSNARSLFEKMHKDNFGYVMDLNFIKQTKKGSNELIAKYVIKKIKVTVDKYKDSYVSDVI